MTDRNRAVGLARGKWAGLITKLCGISDHVLNGNNHPCPKDGSGKTRFRFTDREGTGSYFCHCDDAARYGRAGGMGLLMCCRGWTYHEACLEVEKIVGTTETRSPPVQQRNVSADARRKAKIRSACGPASDAVVTYLGARGLKPTDSIMQGRLKYWDTSDANNPIDKGEFDAMVCQLIAPDGSEQALHVTYIADGKKLEIGAPRKVIGSIGAGSAIRLFDQADEMGIAEGVETALAASVLFNVPVWACYSATILEKFEPPPIVRVLWIFADNDPNGAGQIAAFRCKQRMHARGIVCHVLLPKREGTDWNDVLLEQAA